MKLEHIKIQSFVTSLDEDRQKTVVGASGTGPCMSEGLCSLEIYYCDRTKGYTEHIDCKKDTGPIIIWED